MKIDFFSDLEGELRRLLKEAGLPVPMREPLRNQYKKPDKQKNKIPHYDLENLLFYFFTILHRRLPVIRWDVHISDRLSERKDIMGIAKKLSKGENINNLLSNRAKKLNQEKFPDLLKYEWGIDHLHLNENRTNELLFIYFEKDSAYLIDVLTHEKPDGSVVTWTNTDLIQVMHDNWPHVMKPFILNKKSNSSILTTEQRRTLRKKGANTTVIVNDGTEYLPMGSCFSGSKQPLKAVRQSDYLYLKTEQLQFHVESNFPLIKKKTV